MSTMTTTVVYDRRLAVVARTRARLCHLATASSADTYTIAILTKYIAQCETLAHLRAARRPTWTRTLRTFSAKRSRDTFDPNDSCAVHRGAPRGAPPPRPPVVLDQAARECRHWAKCGGLGGAAPPLGVLV